MTQTIDDLVFQEIIADPENFLGSPSKEFLIETIRRSTRDNLRSGLRHLAEDLYLQLDLEGCEFHLNSHANISLALDPETGDVRDVVQEKLDYVERAQLIEVEGVEQLLCPLYYKDKPMFGYARFEKEQFSTEDLATLMACIKSYSSSLNISMNNLRLHNLAFKDQLTGAYTRTMIQENARQLITIPLQKKQPVSVILIDVNKFKEINDTYGHVHGDHVLRIVAKKAQETVRPDDLIVRWGGDEFLVLAKANIRKTRAMAQRIEDVIAETDFTEGSKLSPEKAGLGYYAGKTAHSVRVSTGVDSVHDENKGDGTALDILTAICEGADQKMYQHKRGSREDASNIMPVARANLVYEGLFLRWDRKGGNITVLAYDVCNFKDAIRDLGERTAWKLFIEQTNMLKDEIEEADWVAKEGDTDKVYFAFASEDPIQESMHLIQTVAKDSLKLLNGFESKIVPGYKLQFSAGAIIYTPDRIGQERRKEIVNNPSETRHAAARLAREAVTEEGRFLLDVYTHSDL